LFSSLSKHLTQEYNFYKNLAQTQAFVPSNKRHIVTH
jgi:hypothetical protein